MHTTDGVLWVIIVVRPSRRLHLRYESVSQARMHSVKRLLLLTYVAKVFRHATHLLRTHGVLGGFLASFLRLEFFLAGLGLPAKPPVSGDVRTHNTCNFPAVRKILIINHGVVYMAYTTIKGLPTETSYQRAR